MSCIKNIQRMEKKKIKTREWENIREVLVWIAIKGKEIAKAFPSALFRDNVYN